MMKAIRSYHAFLSRAYRLWATILLPLIVTGMCTMIAIRGGRYFAYIFTVVYMMTANMITDHWCLGGICHREFQGLEYIKTSLHGEKLMKNVVWVDLLRRLFYDLVIITIIVVASSISRETPFSAAEILLPYSAMLTGFVIETAFSNLLRKIDIVQTLMSAITCIDALATAAISCLVLFIGSEEVQILVPTIYFYFGGIVAVTVLTVVLTAKNMMRHYKLSFTDRD